MTARASVRRAARTLGFAAAATGVLPLHAVHERLVGADERDALKERYKRAWCESMLRLFGVTIELSGAIPPRDRRGRLVVANHRSAIDIVVMLRLFGGAMLSRADIGGWPVLGAIARRIDTVFVDRESARSGAAAVRQMEEALAAGRQITVFPEGTTYEGDEVRTFRRGGFTAAARANVPILPVGVAYDAGSEAAFRDETFLAHLGRVAAAPPSVVRVAVGAPLAPDTAPDVARARVQALVHEARRGGGLSVAGARRGRPR